MVWPTAVLAQVASADFFYKFLEAVPPKALKLIAIISGLSFADLTVFVLT